MQYLLGNQLTGEYKDISKFNNLPILEVGDLKLMENVAIMRYLVKHYPVLDNWYPKDSKKQALVDEYLAWQHHNTRFLCYMYYEQQVSKDFTV